MDTPNHTEKFDEIHNNWVQRTCWWHSNSNDLANEIAVKVQRKGLSRYSISLKFSCWFSNFAALGRRQKPCHWVILADKVGLNSLCHVCHCRNTKKLHSPPALVVCLPFATINIFLLWVSFLIAYRPYTYAYSNQDYTLPHLRRNLLKVCLKKKPLKHKKME